MKTRAGGWVQVTLQRKYYKNYKTKLSGGPSNANAAHHQLVATVAVSDIPYH